MSRCQQEKSIFTNQWVVCLISQLLSLFYSFIIDLLDLRAIGETMRGDNICLITNSYDKH